MRLCLRPLVTISYSQTEKKQFHNPQESKVREIHMFQCGPGYIAYPWSCSWLCDNGGAIRRSQGRRLYLDFCHYQYSILYLGRLSGIIENPKRFPLRKCSYKISKLQLKIAIPRWCESTQSTHLLRLTIIMPPEILCLYTCASWKWLVSWSKPTGSNVLHIDSGQKAADLCGKT